ncbi:MAG: hypothetical protein J2P48_23875, partial [Alphaproteobacteria bacterium]|nr:hypothetical protein [Alphaproteobacteria bacterium]
LANIRNFALMTVMQAQREAAGKLNVYARHIAEDWSVVATSDTFITYSQTIHERGQHIARIFVDKARNAPDKWFALITQSYEIGQFCLDSHYMTIELKNQINDEEGEPPKGPERW